MLKLPTELGINDLLRKNSHPCFFRKYLKTMNLNNGGKNIAKTKCFTKM